MFHFRYLVISVFLLLAGNIVSAEPLFFDSFESGDMSATSEDGFRWGNNNRTSVVTAEEVVWNNGPKSGNLSGVRDWTPKLGSHSLRFAYQPGTEWTEQKFNLGGSYPEIWLKYWIRVPFNFIHGTDAPNNNKFFGIYMDDYSTKGEGATITLEFWRSDSSGSSHITVNRSGGSGNLGHSDPAPFIQVPEDRGRWMEIVIQAVASSSNAVPDGEIRVWRRWENEGSFTKLHELTGELLQVPSTGNASNGWHQGYLMGYANATYPELTEWLVDGFTVSKTSLIESEMRPKPPILTIE